MHACLHPHSCVPTVVGSADASAPPPPIACVPSLMSTADGSEVHIAVSRGAGRGAEGRARCAPHAARRGTGAAGSTRGHIPTHQGHRPRRGRRAGSDVTKLARRGQRSCSAFSRFKFEFRAGGRARLPPGPGCLAVTGSCRASKMCRPGKPPWPADQVWPGLKLWDSIRMRGAFKIIIQRQYLRHKLKSHARTRPRSHEPRRRRAGAGLLHRPRIARAADAVCRLGPMYSPSTHAQAPLGVRGSLLIYPTHAHLA